MTHSAFSISMSCSREARIFGILLNFGLLASCALGQTPAGADGEGVAPEDQMRQHFLREADAAWVRWNEAYESRTDPEAIRTHYAQLRERFIAAIGGLPERTPLNARTTGVIEAEGFRVEKVVFESQPNFYVTASLFLPDAARRSPPYPGILVPCGHSRPGKAHDTYQSMGALLALNGMAALVFDPIDQGERLQSVDAEGQSRFWGTSAHALADIQAIPLGQSVARTFIWDGMRAIDYLQSRPEVDPARIGVTGNSGGGTQASYLLALDDRIKAAAISCYISHLASQIRVSIGEGEQNIFGALSFGLDHPDFLLMRAPTPVKLLAATHDFFDINATWETFRLVKRAYTSLGHSERVEILESDAGHNFDRIPREAAARWLARWLLDEDREIHEPGLRLFSEDELRCTPHGQVMLLPGARSIRDLLRDDAGRAVAARAQTWSRLNAAQRRDAVRRIARFRAMDDLPASDWTMKSTREHPGFRAERWLARAADGILATPALWLEPEQPDDDPVLVFLSSEGFEADADSGGRLTALAKSGRRVLALDVRGTGGTRQRKQTGMAAAVGRDYWDIYSAYMLGRTYVGMQAEDVLTAVREALRRSGATQVDLFAMGGAGVPALHAAFSNPEIFRRVTLENTIGSWDSVVRAEKTWGQFMNVVHGALQTYDLPDLVEALAPTVEVRNPTGPTGVALSPLPVSPEDLLPSRQGLTGVQFGSPGLVNPQATDSLVGGTASWGTERGHDWSARWIGFLVPTVSGDVEFRAETNEEIMVRVGEVVAIEAKPGISRAARVTLAAGKAVPMEIEFNKPRRESELKGHVSLLRILWRVENGGWQPLPDNWLHHSRAQENAAESSLR